MAYESDFDELMTQTLTLEPRSAVDKYGEESYGAAVSVTCRIVGMPKMVRAADGREVVSNGHAFTSGPSGATVTDRLTLPDSTHPVIIRVDSFPDEDGPHHDIIYF
jgi:hypothetical protein